MQRENGNRTSAKTTLPRSSAVFLRERLFREFDGNRSFACTWIAGPPGSGKTALVSSFVSERSLPCLWFHVDADDADPAAFFAHLATAAQSNLGGAAKGLPRFTPDAAFSVPSFARLFFRALFAAVPTLTIALDDYHEAPIACSLHDIIRVAIEQTPAGGHFAVASRTRPPPALARLQANGAVRSLSWDQLMLTQEEVIGIASTQGVTLDRRAAGELHERCGGWVAGLRLLLKSSTTPSAHLAHDGSRTLLFDYLGQEVFRKFHEALQSHLLHLAFLPQIPAGLVNGLVGSPTAERQLAALAEENLFTTVIGGVLPTYRLHSLFRDFLIHRAERELPKDEVLQRRHRAADALQTCGLIDEAAEVLTDAKAWDRLGEMVRAHAPQLMSQGRQVTVERWLTRLPAKRLEDDPWLLYWLGTSRSMRDPYSGRASIEAAFELFARRQDRRGILLAWSGVVDCIFHIYANLRQLDEWIARLESLMAADASFPTPEIEARVTFSMFVVLSFRQPQHPQLPVWRTRLEAMAAVAPDPVFRVSSRLHLCVDRIWQGDMHAAGDKLRMLTYEAASLPTSPIVELMVELANSTYALYAGEVDRCFESIERALETAETSGIHIWDKVLLGQGAILALSHGSLDRGRAFAQRRSAVVRPMDDEEQGLGHLIEAWSSWLGGRQAEALAHVRLGLDISPRMGLPHFNAVENLGMAVVSFEFGEHEAALRQVDVGRALGVQTRNPMLVWMADLIEAYMRLRRGEDASELVTSGMTAAKKHGYRHFFFWPRMAVAAVCFKALELGVEPDYANVLIERWHLAPPPEALQSDLWPWPVKVSTLGTFSVVVHGTPISFKGKVQRAPLNLLKALIAFGGREVAESSIIDALWPDAEGGRGEQTLATTLSRLRDLVGDDVITRQGGRLTIAPNECWVDCWAFERLLNSAVADSKLVAGVRRLYAGPFLRGDDAAWALHLRERLREALVKKLSTAAAAALTADRIELARAIYDAGLEVDDCVEAFYYGQIQCHIVGGQASLAVTTYRRCQRTLLTRLGVPPSPATTRLYLSAIGQVGE